LQRDGVCHLTKGDDDRLQQSEPERSIAGLD
jgi:hypothetical protein